MEFGQFQGFFFIGLLTFELDFDRFFVRFNHEKLILFEKFPRKVKLEQHPLLNWLVCTLGARVGHKIDNNVASRLNSPNKSKDVLQMVIFRRSEDIFG